MIEHWNRLVALVDQGKLVKPEHLAPIREERVKLEAEVERWKPKDENGDPWTPDSYVTNLEAEVEAARDENERLRHGLAKARATDKAKLEAEIERRDRALAWVAERPHETERLTRGVYAYAFRWWNTDGTRERVQWGTTPLAAIEAAMQEEGGVA